MTGQARAFFDTAAGLPVPPGVTRRPTTGPLVNPKEQLPPPLAPDPEKSQKGPWRYPRPYVQRCCQGTLAVQRSGRLELHALACGSWSCPTCRPALAARLLKRTRGAFGDRSGEIFTFATLTVDPRKFGGRPAGSRVHEDGRQTTLWHPPTPAQFEQAARAMSAEWHALTRRLGAKAKRAGTQRVAYLRVVELHRNGWPHWHVVLVHPEWGPAELRPQLHRWALGLVQLKPADPDSAVAEIAPYLLSHEGKSAGAKAYQFAAPALPKGFRLWSSSRGFLPAELETDLLELEDDTTPEATFVLRGNVASWRNTAHDWGAHTVWIAPPPAPPDRPHRPPGSVMATGDGARLLALELARTPQVRVPPSWLRPVDRHRPLPALPAPPGDGPIAAPSG